jgi:chorismate synthase
MKLSVEDIQPQLDRRRPGQSDLSTPRDEADAVTILSGVEGDLTLGTPICLLVMNRDTRPGDYAGMREIPRPSHADLTYRMKYGKSASSGGGRASARETIGRVAGGAIAEKMLFERCGIEIVAFVSSVGGIKCAEVDLLSVSRSGVDGNAVRCPDGEAALRMESIIKEARADGDSVGGTVTCVCRGVPGGLGEPVFGKTEALMASAMLSIPASKSFEIGAGASCAAMRGSEHNDMFVAKESGLGTMSNNSGGVQGGITNGEAIVMRMAFKPPATIAKPQETVDFEGNPVTLKASGRHDPCVVPRAVPVVESMAALVLADLLLTADAVNA